jgi:hypothetical protein
MQTVSLLPYITSDDQGYTMEVAWVQEAGEEYALPVRDS